MPRAQSCLDDQKWGPLKYDWIIKNSALHNIISSSTHKLNFLLLLSKYLYRIYSGTKKE